MSMFIEEILEGWGKNGQISTTFDKKTVRDSIMRSLRNTTRFNGLVEDGYTTMQHSYYVACLAHDFAIIEGICDQSMISEIMLCGLLHDIGECIVGDVVYPIKYKFFTEQYRPLGELEEAFREWAGENVFGVDDFADMWDLHKDRIKRADMFMGSMELIGITTDNDFRTSKCFRKFFLEPKGKTLSDFDNLLRETLMCVANRKKQVDK